MGAVFVVALALAMVVSAGRSVARALLGTVTLLTAVGLALWSVTAVTLGRTPCPRHAGPDPGAGTAAAALGGWQSGAGSDPLWRTGLSSAPWIERTRERVSSTTG